MNQENKIIWYNIVNSLIAGGLVFFGSMTTLFTTDNLCLESFLIGLGLAFCTSALVAIQKFKDFWELNGKKAELRFFHFF